MESNNQREPWLIRQNLCATSDVAEGTAKSFEVGNNVLAVYNVGWRVLRHRQ